MSVESTPQFDPPTQVALDDLQGMIRRRYPTATFVIAQGEDPDGVYLKAIVDVADVDEVVDHVLLDRLFQFQVEQGLPIYVIPLKPIERVLAEAQTRPERPLPRYPRRKEAVVTPRGPGATAAMTSAQKQKRLRGRPRLGQDLSTAVSLRLDQAAVAKLREVAQARGIGPTMLLRTWVLEHLQATSNEA